MTSDAVMQIVQEALMLCLLISAPAVLAAMAVGVLVGLVQTATQVQEQTLTAIPKLIAVFAVLMVCGLWILQSVVDFGSRVFEMLGHL